MEAIIRRPRVFSGIGSGFVAPVSAPQPETLAWVAAVIANGGTVSSGRQNIVDLLIVGLKADNLFSKLDRLWLRAGENQPSALTDIVADQLATAINSPSFTVDRGYTGNGTTSYINEGYNPNTNGVAYTLNSASFGWWSVSAWGTPGVFVMGADDGTNAAYFNVGGNVFYHINQAVPGGSFGNPNGTLTGLFTSSRTASNARACYNNATSLDSQATASTVIPSFNFFSLAENSSGSPSGFNSTHQIACIFMGGGLSSTDVSNLSTRLRTYMTAVGVP